MYRIAIKQLIKWKLDKNKKPLLFFGARQVGKTWLYSASNYRQESWMTNVPLYIIGAYPLFTG
jgi:predicted AAA+ superfamily ATPase